MSVHSRYEDRVCPAGHSGGLISLCIGGRKTVQVCSKAAICPFLDDMRRTLARADLYGHVQPWRPVPVSSFEEPRRKRTRLRRAGKPETGGAA